MKEIQLSKGFVAIVDDEDYDDLSKYKWYVDVRKSQTYCHRNAGTKKAPQIERMHRRIMNAQKGQIIDHINGNGLDNRKSNLRLASITENLANSRLNKRNTSGYRGVSPYKNKWQVHLKCGRNKLYIGLFEDLKEAAKAYNIHALQHFGEFAKLNKIND